MRISFFALPLISASLLVAHEQATHRNLTTAALDYIKTNDPTRFMLLQQYGSIYSTLADGAWNEDNFFTGYPFYLGRFYFHFLPSLNDLGQFANCTSVQWGIQGLSCNAVTMFPLVGFANVPNGHTWQEALDAVDTTTGAPTALGWTNLGYVIHLLEDLTSPPHVHNSGHPCVGGVALCDPFEPNNQLASVNQPLQDYVGLSSLSGPQDLFERLQSYTHSYYFSARTIFNGDGGPSPSFEDPDYSSPMAFFYANCLAASIDFGTCGAKGRRIAYKGVDYYSYLENNGKADRRLAEINSVIAQEQFRELGPATVNAVVALIQLYAPVLTVNIQGNGTVTSSPGTGIDCDSGACSALFVQGSSVALNAIAGVGSVFSGWSGDCVGTEMKTAVSMITDRSCIASFALAQKTITITVTGAQGLVYITTTSNQSAVVNCTPDDYGEGAPPNTCTLTIPVPTSGPQQLFESPYGGKTTFVGWSGDCTGQAYAISIPVKSGNIQCFAMFVNGCPGGSLGSCNVTITSVQCTSIPAPPNDPQPFISQLVISGSATLWPNWGFVVNVSNAFFSLQQENCGPFRSSNYECLLPYGLPAVPTTSSWSFTLLSALLHQSPTITMWGNDGIDLVTLKASCP
jgi:hypothetical protein